MQLTSNLFIFLFPDYHSRKRRSISLKLKLISQICAFWIKYNFITIMNREDRSLFLNGLIQICICDIRFILSLGSNLF